MAKPWLCSGCPSSSAELGLLLLSRHSWGVLGAWGPASNVGRQGGGRSGQAKSFSSGPLVRGPNSPGFLCRRNNWVTVVKNEILNALLGSISTFFAFFPLLKLTHLPLKFEHRGRKAAQRNHTYVGGLG